MAFFQVGWLVGWDIMAFSVLQAGYLLAAQATVSKH